MCCRYYFGRETSEYIYSLAGQTDPAATFPVGDIHPSDCATILTGRKPGIYAEDMRWGFPLSRTGRLLVNARSETVFEKKTFSECVKWRRCVVAARHFYEWDRTKQLVTFMIPDQEIILMAGIWNCFDDGNRFTVLTTAANASVKPVHDRMPVILQAEMLQDWIYNAEASKDILTAAQPQLQREQEYEQLTLALF